MNYKFKINNNLLKRPHILFLAALLSFCFFVCSDGYLSLFDIKDETQKTYTWTKRIGGTSDDAGLGIAADTEGNIIITGYITGSADFNGDGDFSVEFESDEGDTLEDIFIAKYSAAGVLRWAKRSGGSGIDMGNSAAVDGSGNMIITGRCEGDVDFNNDGDLAGSGESGSGIYAGGDAFVLKLDSDGNYLWSKRLGGGNTTNFDEGQYARIDNNENVIITGMIFGNADLNGDGTIDGTLPETASGTYGFYDVFISKFDSTGNNIWMERIGGSVYDLNSGAIADTSNNIMVCGTVMQNADLDGDGVVAAGLPETPSAAYDQTDIFLSFFDQAGSPQWAKRFGGKSTDIGRIILYDSAGNINMTGSITGDADLNGDETIGVGGESSSGYGDYDIFISKYDSTGAYQWSKRMGGTGYDLGNAITLNGDDDLFITGHVYQNADLNGDGIIDAHSPEDATAYGLDDIFLTKFNKEGLWLWSKRLGGAENDSGNGLAFFNKNIFLAGSVTGNADLNGDGQIELQPAETPAEEEDQQSYPEDATGFGGKDIFISAIPDQ